MKHLVDYDEFQIWSNKEKKIKKKKKKKFLFAHVKIYL